MAGLNGVNGRFAPGLAMVVYPDNYVLAPRRLAAEESQLDTRYVICRLVY